MEHCTTLVSPSGTVVSVPAEQSEHAQSGGYKCITLAEAARITAAPRDSAEFRWEILPVATVIALVGTWLLRRRISL